jgi:hypothetical protein
MPEFYNSYDYLSDSDLDEEPDDETEKMEGVENESSGDSQ